MSRFVAFLRAVNVGGTGRLPMAELRALCEKLGFAKVQTYIASGNVLLNSDQPVAQVKEKLETALRDYAGKTVGVLVMTVAELERIAAANPFADEAGNTVLTIFLGETPPTDTLVNLSNLTDEKIALGEREIFVHYPNGMGKSRLGIPAAAKGTARNQNTIRKMLELAGDVSG